MDLEKKQNSSVQINAKDQDAKYEKEAVYIEISGCCNARCSYCVTGVGKHVSNTKFMKYDKFEEIIIHLFKIGILGGKVNVVNLYNFGEPFINPYLDEIFTIVGKYNLKAIVSSNLIKMPEISPENYRNIDTLIFSTCSFKEEEYKRIYKADLNKVLVNFNEFLSKKEKFNPEMKVSVHWLKYNFNKDEFEYAKKYFNERNVYNVANNYYAQLGDLDICIPKSEGKEINQDKYYDIAQAKIDIDFERENAIVQKFAPDNMDNYVCPQGKYLTINEKGHLSGCCGMYSKYEEYDLGDILVMDKNKIFELENKMKICKKCIESKAAWYSHNAGRYTDKDLENV